MGALRPPRVWPFSGRMGGPEKLGRFKTSSEMGFSLCQKLLPSGRLPPPAWAFAGPVGAPVGPDNPPSIGPPCLWFGRKLKKNCFQGPNPKPRALKHPLRHYPILVAGRWGASNLKSPDSGGPKPVTRDTTAGPGNRALKRLRRPWKIPPCKKNFGPRENTDGPNSRFLGTRATGHSTLFSLEGNPVTLRARFPLASWAGKNIYRCFPAIPRAPHAGGRSCQLGERRAAILTAAPYGHTAPGISFLFPPKTRRGGPLHWPAKEWIGPPRGPVTANSVLPILKD